jgi:hypothetical protein
MVFASMDFSWQHCLPDFAEPSFGTAPVKAVPRIATAENASTSETSSFIILSFMVRSVFGAYVCEWTLLALSQPPCRLQLDSERISFQCQRRRAQTSVVSRHLGVICLVMNLRTFTRRPWYRTSVWLEPRKICSARFSDLRTNCRTTH